LESKDPVLISVDAQALTKHQSILQKEQQEAQSLELLFSAWYQQAIFDDTVDPEVIKGLQERIARQEEYIQNRIRLLESMADQFRNLSNHTGDKLDEIRQILYSLDGE